MNKVFFLIIATACSANDAFCQNQALPDNKKTAATGKETKATDPVKVADSQGTFILDMKRSTAPAANAAKLILNTDSTLPPEFFRNEKIMIPPVKDER